MTNDFETKSLRRISELPFAADDEFFRNYPGFKLGVTRCVSYYAQLSLPFVKGLVANDSQPGDWVLTSPAIAARTPAAANLLCWELSDLYMRDTRNTKDLSVIDIQYDKAATASIDYAKLDHAARVAVRERLNSRLVRDAGFHGRPILFVNDIRVTGAQQHAMQQYFERVEAACVKWLYLIDVDPEIGKMDPKIEWQINFAPFEDLLRMVSREEIQFTGKCVLKLMQLDIAELNQVLRALNVERRTRLLELATLNRFQNLDGFQEQMELIKLYGSGHSQKGKRERGEGGKGKEVPA